MRTKGTRKRYIYVLINVGTNPILNLMFGYKSSHHWLDKIPRIHAENAAIGDRTD